MGAEQTVLDAVRQIVRDEATALWADGIKDITVLAPAALTRGPAAKFISVSVTRLDQIAADPASGLEVIRGEGKGPLYTVESLRRWVARMAEPSATGEPSRIRRLAS